MKNAAAPMINWRRAPASNPQRMRFPDKLDVLTVHARLIAETGGTGGIRDEGLLESALAAAENRHHYEAAEVVSCLRAKVRIAESKA